MPMLDRDGATIHFRTAGKGPPIVFASGWATTGDCWGRVVERLTTRFTCVTYDPRGVGRSKAGESAGFEMEDHAEDLWAVCDNEGIYDAHLVGHELGGRTIALAARQHPQLAATLTIVGWWGTAQIHETLGAFDRFKQAASLLLRDLGGYRVLRNVVGWSYRRVPEPDRSELLHRFAEVDARAAYLTALAASDPSARAAFDEAVDRIKIPVLLVRGDEDRDAARDGLRNLFDRLREAELATVHGAGAMPMLEYPKVFAKTLSNFLAEHREPRALRHLND